MGREALARFGIQEEEIARVEAEYRKRDAERLANQAKSGDLHANQHLMFRPDRALADPEQRSGR
jgi:hypothetical protein